jgi:hypothetical protein
MQVPQYWCLNLVTKGHQLGKPIVVLVIPMIRNCITQGHTCQRGVRHVPQLVHKFQHLPTGGYHAAEPSLEKEIRAVA